MRIADRIIGPFLVLFGMLVFWGATQLPKVHGVRYGADLLPKFIGVTLLILGALILIKGLESKEVVLDVESWKGQPKESLAALWSVLGLVLSMILFKPLGFPICGAIFVAIMMALMGARWQLIVLIAPTFVLMLHLVFSGILRVSLPAGPLEAILQ